MSINLDGIEGWVKVLHASIQFVTVWINLTPIPFRFYAARYYCSPLGRFDGHTTLCQEMCLLFQIPYPIGTIQYTYADPFACCNP